MPLYEVVILEAPTKKEAEDGEVERLAHGPVCIVAKDRQAAEIAAALDADIEIDKKRMVVLSRPFV